MRQRLSQQIWTIPVDSRGVPSVDLTSQLFLQRKTASCSAEKCPACPAHAQFKAGQGRMCDVMCWGLQRFTATLHNRKPGVHCLPGWNNRLAQCCLLHYHVILVRDMWLTHGVSKGAAVQLDKEQEEGKDGRNRCIFGALPCPLQASSAEVVLGLQSFPWSQMHFILHFSSTKECQVFSKSVSSPACHEISAGQLPAQFKVHYAQKRCCYQVNWKDVIKPIYNQWTKQKIHIIGSFLVGVSQ